MPKASNTPEDQIYDIVTVMWYIKAKQPVRVTFWYNQVGTLL